MASIIREAVISAPAAQCWDAVRDFGALHKRLAAGFVTNVTMVNERDRRATFFTGAVATERLVGIDEESMRLAYSVIDGPMKATHYNASAQIVPLGPDRCRFVWTIDILPDELAPRVAELMGAGLRAISATLDGG
jgi:hypothetical protein